MTQQPAALENLEARVIEMIATHQGLPIDQVTLDSTFANIGVDSFDGMELILEFEEMFDVSIPHDLARPARSVRDAVRVLREVLEAPVHA
jgi:acyl carrier protein